MLSIIRRMRTREPTCLSIGLGVFFAIKDSYTRIGVRDVIFDQMNATVTFTKCFALNQRSVKFPFPFNGVSRFGTSGAYHHGVFQQSAMQLRPPQPDIFAIYECSSRPP